MSMSEFILKGTTNAPAEGSAGAFYGAQFVFSHVDWLIKVGQIYAKSNSHDPVLPVKRVHKNGYVYIYLMNVKGLWESKYFTSDLIEKGPRSLLTKEELNQNRGDLIKTGMARAPKVTGAKTGNFNPMQYVPTKECWFRDVEIAHAYIGKQNIARMNTGEYVYWYYINPETKFWHSMFFTSWTEVLGGE